MLRSAALLPLLLLVVVAVGVMAQQTPKERAQALVAKMSLGERLQLVHGVPGPYVGNTPALPQYGIPELHLQDGPQGVGDGAKNVTCWPNALAGVASWDLQLMRDYERAMAVEQRGKGTNIMLAPMVNILRVPTEGRSFESFGEDPYLASEMVRQAVKGIQSVGIMACVKHWADNNQEYNRTTISAGVDDRTQHEIYWPAFRAGVEAGTASVMCSYNRVNGTHTCQNSAIFRALKQGEMNFDGFVMSDWGATHSTVESANSGLDMEMPDDKYFGAALTQAVAAGKVPASRIEDMAVRILTAMFQVGIMDTPQKGNLNDNVRSKAHDNLARQIAEAATVLLRNDGVLPLDAGAKSKIAIIGDDAKDKVIATGGGSGNVICPYVVSPFDGIAAHVPSTQLSYTKSEPAAAAIAASQADLAIVFVAVDSHEGADRPTLSLGANQDALVEAVAAANKNLIVVVNAPGAVLMPWLSKTRAVVMAWLPGQEDGNAIGNVLFGQVNPSAKLPLTMPVNDTQNPLHTKIQYPGINQITHYTEKLLVGYRWYDAVNTDPLFPFGHGLSYTSFQYSEVKVDGSINGNVGQIEVGVTVTNTGKVAGAEVAQLYLGYPQSAGEPPKVLRGFYKTKVLQPGEQKNIQFHIPAGEAVSTWDSTTSSWKPAVGTFDVLVGSSSRDIRGKGTFTVSA